MRPVRRTGQRPGVLYAAAVSKRPRPADPRQPDLFAPPGPQQAPSASTAPPVPEPPEVEPPETAPRTASHPIASTTGPEPRPEPRPRFRSVDPLALRAADRPDSYLYCVLTRGDADAVLRDGLPDENPPALVERGAVPRRLAAAAEELGWSDEQPGAIAVLRVRRGEIAPADATPPFGARLRRTG